MLTGTRPEHNGVTGNGTFFREKMPDIVTLPQLFRQHGAAAVSYGKIYHAGLVEGESQDQMLDVGQSWDEAKMNRATKVGNTGPRRNLTGGKLKWCEVADLEGGDDDQSDGQTAQQPSPRWNGSPASPGSSARASIVRTTRSWWRRNTSHSFPRER